VGRKGSRDYLLGVRENIHLGWAGCIARQTEYGFGAMNEWYVLRLFDTQNQWRLHAFVEPFLFNSFFISASHGYAVQANP
jgi:hypothetical protein